MEIWGLQTINHIQGQESGRPWEQQKHNVESFIKSKGTRATKT